jgi:hypothetical protein
MGASTLKHAPVPHAEGELSLRLHTRPKPLTRLPRGCVPEVAAPTARYTARFVSVPYR